MADDYTNNPELNSWVKQFTSNFPGPTSKPLVNVPSSQGAVPLVTYTPGTPPAITKIWKPGGESVEKAVNAANAYTKYNVPPVSSSGYNVPSVSPFGYDVTRGILTGQWPAPVPPAMSPPSPTPVPTTSSFPQNYAGYKGTVTDAMMAERNRATGWIPSNIPRPNTPEYATWSAQQAKEDANRWNAVDLSRLAREREAATAYARQVMEAATMADIQHRADVERWERQPHLFATELAAEYAGRHPSSLAVPATAAYQAALGGEEAATVARAKLPGELGMSEAELGYKKSEIEKNKAYADWLTKGRVQAAQAELERKKQVQADRAAAAEEAAQQKRIKAYQDYEKSWASGEHLSTEKMLTPEQWLARYGAFYKPTSAAVPKRGGDETLSSAAGAPPGAVQGVQMPDGTMKYWDAQGNEL